MVTSKERTSTSARAGAFGLLFSAAVMLFVLLFGGTASADIDDQSSDTTNSGAGVANTGVNGAGGNDSSNTASGDQTATASGAGDESVGANQGGASNASTGSGNVKTGNANATGNSATNNTQQTVVSGHNGAVVLVDQDATITNTGVGIANTGGNTATGNTSTNVSTADQTATATGTDEGVASNTANARNTSGGDARVTTGDATATGNAATNNVNQTFDGNYSGLGVVVIVDQNVDVTNTGVGIANSGLNTGLGNGSTNTAETDQTADATGSVAANNGTASTSSNGSADIMTGDATATGNAATNNVSQIANVTATGTLGSIVLIDQDADVNNTGIALANTGLNTANGNLSTSTSNAVQGAVSGAGPPADDSVAANDGIASTHSDGTAGIHTGHAEAVGNRSNTNLTQVVNVDTAGKGIVLTDQTADVTNTGIGIANTGGNTAVGNSATSNATVDQDADSNTLLGDDAVAANFGTAAAHSNGSASIHTGNANGIGNVATTNIHQTAAADTTGGLFLPDQDANVTNVGIGIANTGFNTAVGNASLVNTANTLQTATVGDAAESAVASNFGEARSTSDGDATIGTGHANAIGNDSGATTFIAQTASANGSDLVLSDQTVTTTDFGVGIANTGLNLAIGNASLGNDTAVNQTANAGGAGDDAVASNFGSSLSNSNGSADVTTGNANAIGSQSHTTIAQTVDANDGGLLLSDQEVTASNTGIGIANTGVNTAIGNASNANTATVNQTATVPAGAGDDTVAANFGTSSSSSDGSASIDTGAANAVGSRTTNHVAQTVDFSGDNFALVDQEVDATSFGVGLANTGVNSATGNASNGNSAVTDQTAQVEFAGVVLDVDADDIVASNDGQAITSSNGSADISTGNAHAIGNDSGHSLHVAQTADINGGGFALIDQEVSSTNVGVGVANTGLNLAIGNGSLSNESLVFQAADVAFDGTIAVVDADDIVASNTAVSNNNSNGSARIHTGAATAVGNNAHTTVAQTADFNSEDGGFALVDQAATESNTGIGLANTGFNTALGNGSLSNSSVVDQTAAVGVVGTIAVADVDDIVASNTAVSNVSSDGDAAIETGDADAIGNISSSAFAQTTDVNTDGGFALVDQDVEETNFGVGIANSGGNTAFGNGSVSNTAGANQTALAGVVGTIAVLNADDVAAVNTANTNVRSDGDASIRTGDAIANGNISSTAVAQTADATFGDNGFALYDQEADVSNTGIGLANTGFNSAAGNVSTNVVSPVDQTAQAGALGTIAVVGAEDIAAVNTATTNVNSNGSASITTGDACGIGNESTTAIAQTADTTIGGTFGFVLLDQEADVVNSGAGIANSGLNLAIGNGSINTVGPNDQNATVGAVGVVAVLEAEDVVAANTAVTNNVSNGSADITTGEAEATGNKAHTAINQVSDTNVDGGGFVLADQTADVSNLGLGIANSGINSATGNASSNTLCGVNTPCTQDATIGAFGLVAVANVDDAAAVNNSSLTNNSNGSASITTGDACACGNESTTVINQVVDANFDGSGFVLTDQVGTVSNAGIGVANTGINTAIGNASTNNANFDQDADVSPLVLVADDVVAANTATSSNFSDGTADINTGNATAYGNVSTSGLNQVVDANFTGTGLVLTDQEADVTNTGFGVANTGLNLGIGNGSINTITSTQDADITGTPLVDDAVAANTVVGNNISNGHVDIDTGDAYALGNLSATGIAQAANYPGEGLFLADQTDSITNVGFAIANSGFNTAAGNTSTNTTTNTATATAPGGVAVNTAELNNISNGTANVRTGDAFAIGNSAANSSCQGINAPINCPVPALPFVPPRCDCGRPTSKPPVVVPPVTPPTTPPVVPPVVPGVTPPGAVLARTGVAVGVQVMLGLLLLAIGALLRRRARTA